MTSNTPLAYTVNAFSQATGVGRTTIFAAIKAGELHTITPKIDGKTIKRRLILPDEGKRWLSTFPATDAA